MQLLHDHLVPASRQLCWPLSLRTTHVKIVNAELGSVRIGRKILVAPDQLTEFIDNNCRPAVSPASLTAEERAATAALTDAERAAARTVAIAEMTARAKERAENPWGRSIRGKRRITAL